MIISSPSPILRLRKIKLDDLIKIKHSANHGQPQPGRVSYSQLGNSISPFSISLEYTINLINSWLWLDWLARVQVTHGVITMIRKLAVDPPYPFQSVRITRRSSPTPPPLPFRTSNSFRCAKIHPAVGVYRTRGKLLDSVDLAGVDFADRLGTPSLAVS